VSKLRTRTALLAAALGLLLPACQQEMARQPSYRPLEQSDFFADGRSARPIVEGTVHRDQPLDDDPLVVYLKRPAGKDAPKREDYVTTFPFKMDEKALRRGQERFQIFCAVCHDELGTGNGKIVERGYLKPPNYHTDESRGFQRRGQKVLLRDAPVGYFYEVITHGFGAMPDYASQISPADRWKIAAYIRVLQRSQYVPLGDLPEPERKALEQMEVKP
jgi:mono/diheme cytochrome c family protein